MKLAKDTCPVIAAYLRRLGVPWDDRDVILAPYPMRVQTTLSTPAVKQRRAYVCADYAARVVAPRALDFVGLGVEAQKLRELPAVASREEMRIAHLALRGVVLRVHAAELAVPYADRWNLRFTLTACVQAAEACNTKATLTLVATRAASVVNGVDVMLLRSEGSIFQEEALEVIDQMLSL